MAKLHPAPTINAVIPESQELQQDIETLQRENQNLRELARDFYAILENTADFVYVKDVDLRYTTASNALARVSGHAHWTELVGKTDDEIYPAESARRFTASDRRVLEQGRELQDSEEMFPLLHDGDGWVSSTKKRMFDSDGKVAGLIGISKDVTRRVRSRQKIEHLAHHDTLTGLPNRNLLDQHFRRTVSDSVIYDETYALMYIDLDDFKPVNDQYGHNVGDLALTEVANRLRTVVGQRGLVIRLSGDEFAIKMKISSCYEDLEKFVKHLITMVGQPIRVTHADFVEIGCSIGVTKFKGSEANAAAIIDEADKRMYEAKAAGKNQYRFHESFGLPRNGEA